MSLARCVSDALRRIVAPIVTSACLVQPVAAAPTVSAVGSVAAAASTGTATFNFDFGSPFLMAGFVLGIDWNPDQASLTGVTLSGPGSLSWTETADNLVDPPGYSFDSGFGTVVADQLAGTLDASWFALVSMPVDGAASLILSFAMANDFSGTMPVSLRGTLTEEDLSSEEPYRTWGLSAATAITAPETNIPEPASLALALAGLGLLGAHAARRRVRAIA